MSEQNPREDALSWRRQAVDPSCSVLRIEVAWGAWPYRITAYDNEAVVVRLTPGSPARVKAVPRGGRPFEAMLAEARSVAEDWDRTVQDDAADAGLAALR